MNTSRDDVFSVLAEARAAGEPVTLVTIVAAHGSTPQRVGAKMLVFEDGRTVGTIGGGCYENDAFWKAREALTTGRSQLVKYELNDDFAEESGLICGGQMEVFVEPIMPAARLYVIGAGHVGFHVARLAATVGFKVHVVDDREKFANAERFPDAEEVIVEAIPEWLAEATLPSHSYVLVLTRGHRHDLDAMRELARRDVRYIGLIGSRAKVARIFRALEDESGPNARLHQIHAPVGLDIGAVTPEEIAVSIVAELIAVKYGRTQYGDGEQSVARSMRWSPSARNPVAPASAGDDD